MSRGVSRRRVLSGLCILALLPLLSGCPKGGSIFGGRRSRQERKEFRSPIAPVAQGEMSQPEVMAKLGERNSRIESIRASLDLTVGSGRGSQQFQTSLFIKNPDFLRVRGSQNAGTVFDVLISRGEAQVLVHPERKFYRGTVDQLRAHPEILMGINPQDLVNCFQPEQTLVRNQVRSDFAQAPVFQSTPQNYQMLFVYPSGMTERFTLRKSDLLVASCEKLYGQQAQSTVRFWAYDLVDGRYLLPTDFSGEVANGNAAFSARVSELRVNEPMSPQLAQITVPDGFERMAIGR